MLKSRRKLLIVGAGDFAREVLWAANDISTDRRDWDVVGFLDDEVDASRERMRRAGVDLPVQGTIKDYTPQDDTLLVCAIGSPKIKLPVCEMLRARGAQFANVIHPTVALGPGCKLGTGVILWRQAVVSVNVTLGDFVTMQNLAAAGHDAVIEDGCTLSSVAEITGHVHLEQGVFMGSHAVVLPSKRVGAFAKVGAGSVVMRNVEPGDTVFGVPAKVYRFND